MLGEVVYTPDNFIAEQIATLGPVLDSVKNLDIILSTFMSSALTLAQ